MRDIQNHAYGIAQAIAENDFWKDVDLPGCKTVRDLCFKRLQWWINNMEGDMPFEAPMYTNQLSKEVMEIIDKATATT